MPRLAWDSVYDPRVIAGPLSKALGRKPDACVIYLSGPGKTPAAAIPWLRQQGYALTPIWSPVWGTDGVAGGYSKGIADGQEARARASALGFPTDVTLWVDIETNWATWADKLGGAGAMTGFLRGWAVGAGAPCGVYCNPSRPQFCADFAAARQQVHPRTMALWSCEPEPGGAPTVPGWAPSGIPDVATSMWQWQQGWWLPGAAWADLDLIADSGVTLWEADDVGQWTDVPQSAWYAQDAADMDKIGWMKGTTPTTFDPEGAVTRAQLAVFGARVARSVGLLPAAPVGASGRRYGALRSKLGHTLPTHADVFGAAPPTSPAYILLPHLDKMPHLNQGGTPECVEFAATWAHYWLQVHAGIANPVMGSQQWLYGLAGGPMGTDPATAWAVMHHDGLCPESLDPFPSLASTWGESGAQAWQMASQGLTPAMSAAAAPYAITGAAQVPLTVEGIYAALATPRPVLLSLNVNVPFEAASPTAPLAQPLPADLAAVMGSTDTVAAIQPGSWVQPTWQGGHEVNIVGLLPSDPYFQVDSIWRSAPWYLVIWNSWGQGWGSGGCVLLPLTYPMLMEAFTFAHLAESLRVTPSPLCPGYAQRVEGLQSFLDGPLTTNKAQIVQRYIAGGKTAAQAEAAWAAQCSAIRADIAQTKADAAAAGCQGGVSG